MMNNSKVAIVVSAIVEKIQFILGVLILIFFGLMALVGIIELRTMPDIGFYMVFCLTFVAIGILLVVFSRKRNKLLKDFKEYVAALSNDPSKSIANLANRVGTSQEVVYKNLDMMIKRKYFVNAYIDRGANCLVLPNSNQNQGNGQQAAPAAAAASPAGSAPAKPAAGAALVTVTCKSCGGVNRLPKGQVGECEYCGSPING